MDRLDAYLAHGTPSHDTFGAVFAVLDAKAFEKCFRLWVNSLAGVVTGVIALDGKTLRGSGSKGGNDLLHVVSAYATESGLCLAQEATEGKGNELAATKALLDQLMLRGCIVTLDALGCQKDIAKQIVERGGDYLLQVKGNQKNLLETLQDFFETGRKNGFGKLNVQQQERVEKDHGRLETRRYTWIHNVAWMDKSMREAWSQIGGVGMIESTREINGKVSTEIRYAIGSKRVNTVGLFAKASREHWGIENQVHWVLDVTFREDACRARTDNAAQNLSVVRKFSLSVLRQEEKPKRSLQARRTLADRDAVYRESLILQVFRQNL